MDMFSLPWDKCQGVQLLGYIVAAYLVVVFLIDFRERGKEGGKERERERH